MSETTGFHAVPWDLFSANGGELDGLPAKTPRPENDGGACCPSEWIGLTDATDESPWACCLPPGHPGTHRGSDSVSTVAEWRDEDAAAHKRREAGQ